MSELIEQIFAQARLHNLPKARLADKAGVRPETLSRLKHQDNCDLRTLNDLALAVGYRLALIPIEQEGARISRAREKAQSRRSDEALIAAGLASKEEVQRRNGFFSLPGVGFSAKNLTAERD